MMKRRILTGLLACCLSLSLALPGFAAGAIPSPGEVSQVVTALGILDGNSGGSLELSRNVTRAEFITMALKASPNGDQVGEASTSPYPDVPYTHWAAGYVEAAVAAGLVTAYSDGTFRPDSPITLAEGASMALALLGYTAEDFSGAYPTPQLALYRSLGLDQGVSAQKAAGSLTRQDAMYLFYNLLTAPRRRGRSTPSSWAAPSPPAVSWTWWVSSMGRWRAPWWPPATGAPPSPSLWRGRR